MRIREITLVAAIVFFQGCATNKNEVKEIETELEKKSQYRDSNIGVNDSKEVVIQTEKGTDSELRDLAWKSYDLEQRIQTNHEALARCRDELSDPRLGGTGTVTEIPEVDVLKAPTQMKEELGITSRGELKLVKKEFYMERLEAERKYVGTLSEQDKIILKHRKNCERDMRVARVQHGLPGERYPAVGKYVNGKYVQVRGPEYSLDDAFEILTAQKQLKNEVADD